MCLLCLSGDKSINHFNTFLLPSAAAGGSAPGSATAIAPREGQGSRSLPQSAPTAVQAFTTAAIVGLAKADRTPAQQRALVATATTLSGLAAASATTQKK
jgi:hypothetical protein